MSVDLSRHEQVKLRLREKGSSLTKVANHLGIEQPTVTVVSQGYRRSRRIEAELARVLGTTPQKLFPERYPTQEDHTTG